MQKNDFNNFGFQVMDPRACTMFIPLVAILDASGSMSTILNGLVTRFLAAVAALIKSLRRLAEDDLLADNVHLFLYTFSGHGIRCICDGIPLSNLDIDQLERDLLDTRPSGGTPMGAAIMESLQRMLQVKEAARARGDNYKQPLLCMVSDGEPTDDMSEALNHIDQLQKDSKLVLLPFAIGEPDQRFPLFERMCACSGGELEILTTESDIRRHFRLIDRTIRLDEIEVTPLSQFGCDA